MLRDGPMIDAHRVTLAAPDDFDGWREAARGLAEAGIPPEAISWQVAGGDAELFGSDLYGDDRAGELPPGSGSGASFAVPKRFVDLARSAVCHSDPERFALLYSLLWRIRSDRRAIEDRADPLLNRIDRLAKEVRRDIHKMHAFVRFREVDVDGETSADGSGRFVAFFEPTHHTVRAGSGFFVRRFPNMLWSILTPELSVHWDGKTLLEGPGATRSEAPAGDPLEEMWRTYYASIFNPARLKIGAMLKEMPKKYWRNMPETSLVASLVAGAQAREAQMIERSGALVAEQRRRGSVPAAPRVAPGGNVEQAWQALRAEAAACTRCDLHRCATQTVFGEGPLDARILFVGEQPGDQEDLAGRPFVGPAGQLFDEALAQAGIDRSATYVTNAVKHFKFVTRGKKRIHQSPASGEIEACRWWIEQERELIRPPLTVALGATAARSLVGKAVTIGKVRGSPLTLADGSECWVTVHPSYLLRIPDRDRAAEERQRFVADLAQVRQRSEALAAD